MISSQDEMPVSSKMEPELNKRQQGTKSIHKSRAHRCKRKSVEQQVEKTVLQKTNNNRLDATENKDDSIPKIRVREIVDRFNREAEIRKQASPLGNPKTQKKKSLRDYIHRGVSTTSITSLPQQSQNKRSQLTFQRANTYQEIVQNYSDQTIVAPPSKTVMRELESDVKMISLKEPKKGPAADTLSARHEAAYQSRTTIAKTENGVRIVIDIFFDGMDPNDCIGSRVETSIPTSRILNEFQEAAASAPAIMKRDEWGRNDND